MLVLVLVRDRRWPVRRVTLLGVRLLAIVLLAACSSGSAAPPSASRSPAPSPSPAPSGVRRWIPGDLHVHPAPFDIREGNALTVAEVDAQAPAAGLEWIILTPHVHPSTWNDPDARRAWLARWQTMAAAARAAKHLTIIPGTEFTSGGYGHFGVSGVDLGTVGDDVLAGAAERGAFIVVNHPFAVAEHITGFPISDYDLSFHPWTKKLGPVPHLDGVEVWNIPLALANIVRRDAVPGETQAFAAADALARADGRPIAVVGGSDTHSAALTPTTWVLAPDASADHVLAALRRDATCVGSPAAGSLEAHGDRDPADRWAAIGETAKSYNRVQLRWTGHAQLFIDGRDAGEHDDGFTDTDAEGMHTYRIVIGASRCGFVYSNLGS